MLKGKSIFLDMFRYIVFRDG